MKQRLERQATVLFVVGATAFTAAMLGWLGIEANHLATFRGTHGWVPAYGIFTFIWAGIGLMSIAFGKRHLGQLAGAAIALQGMLLLYASLMPDESPVWLQDLITEYAGQTPFSLLSGARPVIICNLSVGFALVAMGARFSLIHRNLAIGFFGSLVFAQPLSEIISYVLQIRTHSDLSLPLFVGTSAIRILVGWSILLFAYRELQPQLRLERIPWLPLSLVVSMLAVTLITWRALIAEGEEHLREKVQRQMEHLKAEINDGIEHCFNPVFGIAEDWVKRGRSNPPARPDLNLLYGHRQGLLSVEAADRDYRSYWVARNETGMDSEAQSRRSALSSAAAAQGPVLVSVDKSANQHALVVPVRSNAAHGFLVASYAMDQVFQHILHPHALQGIELVVLNGGNELYANQKGEGENRWIQETTMKVYGEVWRVRVAPTEALVSQTISALPWVVLLTGSLLTLALVWVYYLRTLAQVRVRHLAEEIECREQVEAKLQQLNQDLEQRVRERTQELANEKELLAVTMESIGDGVITTDTGGIIRSINDVAQIMTGWRAEHAIGKDVTSVFLVFDPMTRQAVDDPVMQVLGSPRACHVLHKSLLIARDGKERLITDSAARIRDRSDRVLGVVLVFKDITEAQKMEEELFRARNLDAIGLLAGGIAHDFNNILTGITGNVSLARLHARPGDIIHESLEEAEKAFTRARDLTMQLLTFSRGGAPIRKSASVGELIQDTASFVLRGTNVRAQIDIDDQLWAASIDPGQISQAINNLLINATQAMPHGGTIFISAHNRELSADEKPIAPGRYVELTIRDQGTGITSEHMPRIFEPYFTTKTAGNGLGLATTYSIIKRHKGHIEVESVAGSGTTFRIYLSAAHDKADAHSAAIQNQDLRGRGRVLVMDDDEQIRDIAARSLVALGYEFALSSSGEEAVVIYRNALQEGRPFDVVILDLTVPGGMGGKECLQQLRRMNPQVRAIVSSGYSNDPTLAEHARHGFDATVVKPYVVQELATALREVLMEPVVRTA